MTSFRNGIGYLMTLERALEYGSGHSLDGTFTCFLHINISIDIHYGTFNITSIGKDPKPLKEIFIRTSPIKRIPPRRSRPQLSGPRPGILRPVINASTNASLNPT